MTAVQRPVAGRDTAPGPGRTVSPVRLALLHLRFGFLETIRVPVALVGNVVFPSLALLFFVVPQQSVAGDPVLATAATAQLATFAVMSTCIFTYGIGIAEDRALPFDPFVRTLPAGPGPRMAGRVMNGAAFSVLGVVPLLLVGWLLTDATVTAPRLLAGFATLLLIGVPFLFLGLALGYTLTAKAAVAVTQLLVFPLGFGGGMFLPPELFPDWLDAVSRLLPSRAARDVVVPVVTGGSFSAGAVVVLVAWSVVLAALASLAYRRDEGRRFR